MTLAGGQRKFNRSAAPFGERQAHFARWLLLGGWCFLIVSLLVPWWDFWPVHLDPCDGQHHCHHRDGNQIFWGSVVPLSVLMLVVHSHELWRRLCPLAFVSRLAGSLGLQRNGRSGRRPARVEPSSWLGRHHVQLQWSLFIAGLSLRLLMLNNTPQLLGLFLGFTLLAAALVGWAYEGKAWCQFVCPMAPVQSVLTGPRSLLGSSEAGLSRTRFPESMCITLHPQGEERRGCTGCIRPCIDISATDTYWHDLSGKRGLQFAWTSYPGLVMGFFLLMLEQLHDRLGHVRSGLWAYRSDSLELLFTPLHHDSLLHLPRLVSLPALLVLSGCLSTGCFLVVQALLSRRLRRYLAAADARRLARHRTRLLATFTAVNVFFFFSDPSLGALWGAIGWAVRLLVGGVSLLWLQRHWSAALPSGRRISVAADSWSDVAGNLGKAAFSAEITDDTQPPTNNVANAGDLYGDVNGDGLSDLIASPTLCDSSEDMDARRASVVFGKADTFAISGGSHGDKSNYEVAAVGDVCGDGLSDLIVSPPLRDSSEDMDAWCASVVFGKASTASHFSPPADRAAARGVHHA